MSFVAPLSQSSALSGDDCGRPEERLPIQSYWMVGAAVVICGTLNNFTYCIISGASQNLARHFGMRNQVTLLTASMNVACLIATLITTRVLLRFRYYCRVMLVLSMTVVAYLGIAVSLSLPKGWGFAATLLFSSVAGMQQVFGETTNLAFLKSFPPELVGGWGAGTGIAGILGSYLYILFTGTLGMSNQATFLVLVLPCSCIYFIAFSYLHKQVTRHFIGFRLMRALGGSIPSRSGGTGGMLEELQPAAGTAPPTMDNVKAAIKASGSIMFNLVAVYCLEYIIYPGIVDRETMCASSHWYPAMWMCYNIGVTLSRSSVSLFRIQRVWMLTVFQLMNVIGWTAEVYTGRIRNSLPNEGGYYIMAAWMVVVGLCGGAAYGNCMYLFNTQEGIPNNLRELGISLGFVMSNIGISTATCAFSLLDVTILSGQILYPHGCNATNLR